MSLGPKQHKFIEEYLKDLNATQAAIRAGYSSTGATSQGSRLLANRNVAAVIADTLKRRSERVEINADTVLRELLKIATTDIGEAFDELGNLRPLKDIPPDVRRAISGVETVEEFAQGADGGKVVTGLVRKVKFWDKVKSLELLGKNLKLFTDVKEHRLDAKTLEQLVTLSLLEGDAK